MYKIKLLVIALALLQPLIIIYVFGVDFKSFSKVYGTVLEPIFIIANASTSFFFFSLNRWKIPSVLLLLLTAFNTNLYSELHNFLATLFFLSCVYALLEYKRRRIFLFFYCSSLFLFFYSLFWFEFFATWILCAYHLKSLYIMYKFENREQNAE